MAHLNLCIIPYPGMTEMELQKNTQSLYDKIKKLPQYENCEVCLMDFWNIFWNIDTIPDNVIHSRLWKLSRFIELLSKCDVICFMEDWIFYGTCRKAFQIADFYKIPILLENEVCEELNEEDENL